jgi:hypothetical protein
MNKEDIIRMAKEAGGDDWGIFRDFMPEIERFANLVAAAEREACAKKCEELAEWHSKAVVAAFEFAAEEIRERMEK